MSAGFKPKPNVIRVTIVAQIEPNGAPIGTIGMQTSQ